MFKFYDEDQPLPKGLTSLIGKRVLGAWVSDTATLYLLLEGRRALWVSRVPSIGFDALSFHTGTLRENADFSGLAQEPHCAELAGHTFLGFEGPIVVFSGDLGAMMLADGVRLVQRAPT